MLRASLTAYPWDLLDEGIADVLDRLHGEVGIAGVSVWAASPPVLQLRARDVSPRTFRTRGGLFFPPDEQHYAGTRCKPVVSEWLKGRHPLKRIHEACTERGMTLRAVVSASMTGRAAKRHGEMACKNAFDDASHRGLCLANPDVQAYLCGLTADLSSNHRLAGVVITDFVIAWPEALGDEVRSAVPLGETERVLLSTCFCESCHQRAEAAGVDVPATRRSVQTILQKSFDGDVAGVPALDALLADNAPLADYYLWRSRELSSLLSRLTKGCKCDLLLDRRVDAIHGALQNGLDLSTPAGVITRIGRREQLESALCSTARRNELRLAEALATGDHAAELVTTLTRAAELGFANVEIDNYGLLPDGALTPIRQAIRFARRLAKED